LFKILRESNIVFNKKLLLASIWQSIWRYFGMKEANKIGLWLIELDLKRDYGIIRCSHTTKEIIISALSLIKEINENRVILSPIKTFGTIISLNKLKNLIFN
jgi:RNase P/RNase MRP subunit POP5